VSNDAGYRELTGRTMSQSIAGVSRDVTPWRERLASRFFLTAAIVMLVILVLGFVPTLLLRPLFDVPPIPAYLHSAEYNARMEGPVSSTILGWFQLWPLIELHTLNERSVSATAT
jgi:hypothetical protein